MWGEWVVREVQLYSWIQLLFLSFRLSLQPLTEVSFHNRACARSCSFCTSLLSWLRPCLPGAAALAENSPTRGAQRSFQSSLHQHWGSYRVSLPREIIPLKICCIFSWFVNGLLGNEWLGAEWDHHLPWQEPRPWQDRVTQHWEPERDYWEMLEFSNYNNFRVAHL